METRQHIHSEEFSVLPEKMFEVLHKPSAICVWWNASRAIVLPEENGIWTAAWGKNQDEPDYITSFTIKEFEPPDHMLLTNAKYFSKDGKLPFKTEMTTEFIVKPTESGCTLKVIQDGFPKDKVADDYYEACQTGWRDTFNSIRKYLTE